MTLLDEEQQNEGGESQAAKDHSTQQETEATLIVHHLREERDSTVKRIAQLVDHDGTSNAKVMGSIPRSQDVNI